MATKRLRRVFLSAAAELPLPSPIPMSWVFEYEIDGLPEIQRISIEVGQSVTGATTYAQSYVAAKAAVQALLESEGLGGHTVVEGPES